MLSLLFFNNMVHGASHLILLYFCKVIKDSSPYIGVNFDMVFEKQLPFLFYFTMNDVKELNLEHFPLSEKKRKK